MESNDLTFLEPRTTSILKQKLAMEAKARPKQSKREGVQDKPRQRLLNRYPGVRSLC